MGFAAVAGWSLDEIWFQRWKLENIILMYDIRARKFKKKNLANNLIKIHFVIKYNGKERRCGNVAACVLCVRVLMIVWLKNEEVFITFHLTVLCMCQQHYINGFHIIFRNIIYLIIITLWWNQNHEITLCIYKHTFAWHFSLFRVHKVYGQVKHKAKNHPIIFLLNKIYTNNSNRNEKKKHKWRAYFTLFTIHHIKCNFWK